MIVVKLQGGLGNQMFQYAIGKVLEHNTGASLLFDCSFFDDQEKRPGFTPRQFELGIFNPLFQTASKDTIHSFFVESNSRRLRKNIGLPYKKIYREDVCSFDVSILSLKGPVYLDGYFQSENYYAGNEQLVYNLFQFPEIQNYQSIELINSMESSTAVSVHFRRGDYVSDAVTGSFHGICSLDYYKQAFQLMDKKIASPHFYIFSDDIQWVEEQVAGWTHNITLVKRKNDAPAWLDMMLMSKCRHHIIANSSFSWWGAWLNNMPGKQVIAPRHWFNNVSINTNDLVPAAWVRI